MLRDVALCSILFKAQCYTVFNVCSFMLCAKNLFFFSVPAQQNIHQSHTAYAQRLKLACQNITRIPSGFYNQNAREKPQTTIVVEDFLGCVRQPAHCEATRTHTHEKKIPSFPLSLVPLDPRVFPKGVKRTACIILAVLFVLVVIHPDCRILFAT
jgi:hypothetical protein